MDWLEELAVQEAELREHLAQLAQRSEAAEPPPAVPRASDVRPTVEAMQKALDDYLSGRGRDELSWLSQEVRRKLPLLSHLRYLRSLVPMAGA